MQPSVTARFRLSSHSSLTAELLGDHDDIADLLAFLDEIGIGVQSAGGGPHLALYRSSRTSGHGDTNRDAIDLDLWAERPEEALVLLDHNRGAPVLTADPDGPARVRVAAARRLWRPSVPDRGQAVPSDLACLVPQSDPDAAAALIIPCHDDGHLLVDALASIRLCAPELFHVVVVDDGSTAPATIAVLDAVEQAGITVARQAPGGVSRARNHGVQRTRAPYLVHLDADNLLRPGFVPEALRLLSASPHVAVVHGDAQYFGHRQGRWSTPAYDPVRLLTGNYLDVFAVVRRQAIEGVGGWDEDLALGEDWELWLSLTKAGWDFARLPIVGLDYRLRDNSLRFRHDDPEARKTLAVAMTHKHHALYARHLPGVIANFTSAVVSSGAREPPQTSIEADRETRGLIDQLAALRAELSYQMHLAGEARRLAATENPSPAARRRIGETEERAAGAERRLVEAERRGDAAEQRAVGAERRADDAEHLAAAADRRAGRAEQRANDAEAELSALRSTRTFRWLATPRTLYGRLRSVLRSRNGTRS